MAVSKIHFYIFGDFRLDVLNKKLFKKEKQIRLAPKGFEVLLFLIQNKNKVIEKQILIDNFWREEYVEEKNLVQQIYQIRKALKSPNKREKFIETVPKYGYQFVAEVKAIPYEPEEEVHEDNEEISDFSQSEVFHQNPTNSEISSPTSITKDSYFAEENNSFKTKQNSNRNYLVYTSLLLLVGIIFGTYYYFTYKQNPNDIESIAILPFKQIGDKTDEKLGLGMADSLISQLGSQEQVRISPTSTIIRFTEEGNDDPILIGSNLNVDAVLTGTIQKDSNFVRINVQLISVKDNKSLWTGKFDENFSDIFSLQDKIASKIAQELSINTKNLKDTFPKGRFTKNAEAYKEYTLGLFYWNKREPESLQKAVNHFQTSIEKDPEFALGYALLADSYALLGMFDLVKPSKEKYEKAINVAEQAETISPNLNDIYIAKGLIYLNLRDVKKARTSLEKALELNKYNATAHQRFALLLATEGRLAEAYKEIRLAHELNPISVPIKRSLSYYLYMARKPDESLKHLHEIEKIDKTANVDWYKANAYEQKKDYEKALSIVEKQIQKYPKHNDFLLTKSRIFAKQGLNNEAEKLLDKVLSEDGKKYSFQYYIALSYLNLGEEDKAFKILDKLSSDSLFLFNLRNDYQLDSIRNTERFQLIISKSEMALFNNNTI